MTTWTWRHVRAGRLLLDGGGMFGIIPRVVWTRAVQPDDKNRIEIAHNCLLLESAEPDRALGRPRRVLIEAGTGDKMDPKMAGIFGLDGRTVEACITEAGVDPGEIDHAIVTHLHFDHAGGLTRLCRAGEAPDWTVGPGESSGEHHEGKLTFSRAEVIVQAREWADALANDAVMTRTYFKDHLLPLKAPLADGRARVRLVESPTPFAPGRVPHRDEAPATPVDRRWTEVLPGIRVFSTPGHTWGQQAVAFDAADGRTVVFTPDLMPTAWHVGQTYSLGYDVEPYTAMVTKRWFLTEAAERGWTLVLDHEPGVCMRTVRRSGSWFDLDPAP